MKKIIYASLFLLFVVLITSFSFFFWWTENIKAPTADSTKATITVLKGSSADTIGGKLLAARVIRSELAFKIYLKLNHLTDKLPVGQFEIQKNLSLAEVVSTLLKGPTEVWVTVPEGLRREQIPSRFTVAIGLAPDASENWQETFLAQSKDLEGYLYPDTYLVPKDITAEQVVNLMKTTFMKKYQSFTKNTPLELTDNEIVTLASLVERETLNGNERPMVAGILYNRLMQGMPLQVDASVQYVLANMRCKVVSTCTEWWPTVLRGDYTLSSPFNTYKISGLPPSPIANAGESSLMAALNPTKSQYLYYLHDKDGLIHYAKTFEEHTANVQKYIN